MRTLIQGTQDLIFPRRCPICDRPVRPFGAMICTECANIPEYVGETVCRRCGKPVAPEQEYCEDCRRNRHLYTRGIAVFTYRSVSGSLYRFKYERRREYAAFYGKEMSKRLLEEAAGYGKSILPDFLVPVPVSPQRLRRRGYNQAALLAGEVSARTGIPMREDVLGRKADTPAMRNAAAEDRKKNLKNAFLVYGNGVRLKSIMLVDDIYTTGATIDACAGALLASGAQSVSFLALAIGEKGYA